MIGGDSCCDHHMLGDIVCNHLFVSHLVVTFSVGDHCNGHGRYAVRASGSNKHNEHVFSLCLSRQIINIDRGRNHTNFAYIPRIMIIADKNVVTKWVTKSSVLIKMSPSVWLILQLLESRHWSSLISVVYVSWFELCFSHKSWWLKQWQLSALISHAHDILRHCLRPSNRLIDVFVTCHSVSHAYEVHPTFQLKIDVLMSLVLDSST